MPLSGKALGTIAIGTRIRQGRPWRYAGPVLILATLLLFTTKATFNLPLAVMMVWGLIRWLRDPRSLLRDADLRLLTLAFLCLWIPLLASLPDAVKLSRALNTTLWYPRFLLAGIFVVTELRDAGKRAFVLWGTLAIVAFWCTDALLQYVIGVDVFGYPLESLQVPGMFYPMLRLGVVTAPLLPVYFEAVRLLSRRSRWAVLLLLPAVAAVYLSNNRNAWLSLLVAAALYGLWAVNAGHRFRLRPALAVTALLVVGLGAIVAASQPLQQRLAITAELFSGDYERTDQATSYRLSLWRTALAMARENPLNGVGPRGYRFVYEDYAAKDDFWLERYGKGQTHPHQQFLEIAAETGLPGLLGYAAFLFLLIVAVRGSPQPAFLLGALVAAFPLNAHMAFYGTYWSTLLWWLIPIGVAGGSVNGRMGPLPLASRGRDRVGV